VFRRAVAKEYRDDVPSQYVADALPKVNREVQHLASLPYVETPEFIEKLRTYPSIPVRLAFELLILCANRPGEVLSATWDEIDLEARVWSIPGNRMKGNVLHMIPLSTRAIEILHEAKALSTGSKWVFPGTREARPLWKNSFDHAWAALGYKGKITA